MWFYMLCLIIPACSYKNWWHPETGNMFALNQERAQVKVCHCMWLWPLVLSSSLSVWKMIALATTHWYSRCSIMKLQRRDSTSAGFGTWPNKVHKKTFGVRLFVLKTAINCNGPDIILIFEEYLSCMAIIWETKEAKIKQVGTHKVRT